MLDPRTELSANRAVAGANYSVNGSWGGGRSGRSHERYGAWNGGGDWQFGGEAKGEDESGVCSPPLWKTSPPGSPNGGNSPPHRRPRQNHYRSLSPASKMQAIAQGQRELMEMVRNMPESCYELSLRDLVEQPVVQPPNDSHPEMRNFGYETAAGWGKNKEKDRKKKADSKPTMARSGSLDNGGFLLKMVFPVSLRSKNKNKKKNSATNTCSKVSPKPLASDGSAKSVDKEWWKKRVTVAGDSDGRRTTGNSGSTASSRSCSSSSSSSICSNSSSRHLGGLFTVCWSYFISKKRKTKE